MDGWMDGMDNAWMGGMDVAWTGAMNNAWTGAMTDIMDDVHMVGVFTVISCR